MRVLSAIFTKQLNDALKNPTVTMTFLMLPLLAFLMVRFGFMDATDDVPVFAGVATFAAMGAAIMPITAMTSYISEDIETRSLRFLVMAGVKPTQYLLGISSFIILLSFLSMLAFGFAGELSGSDLILFLSAAISGILPSTALGALLGIVSKNVQQGMTLGSIFGILLGLVPMFAMVNDTIMNISNYLFSQQVSNIFMYIAMGPPTHFDWSLTHAFVIIGANFLVFAILFFVIYKKRGMNLD
jgi:ABC-2 type transport system permease protein